MLSQQHSIAAEAYPEQTFGAALPAAAGLPLQQGPSLQGCPEQSRPQLPLRLMPRPEAASSYASEDCMQCDTLRGAETHMVKPLICKRRSAVVLL